MKFRSMGNRKDSIVISCVQLKLNTKTSASFRRTKAEI